MRDPLTPDGMTSKNWILTLLLVFVPVSIVAHLWVWDELVIFLAAAIAIIPLAGWMGAATEEIAVVLGPSLGGLINATFGNATELIIALVALRAGLTDVVKASITGSIIGNLLLVMGLAMLLGGLRYKEQTFQPVVARLNASSMNLAVIAVLLPTTMSFGDFEISQPVLENLSIAVAVVLILVYGLSLLFSMKTHAYLCDVGAAQISGDQAPTEELGSSKADHATDHQPNLWLWVGVLLVATVLVAIESEFLVSTLETATSQLGLTKFFTGVILLPIIGNAAEHATAVTVAMKNKMDLSMAVAVGSSLQIALFVGPILVLAGWAMGQPMDLNFTTPELIAVAVAVLIANSISSDGKSNWLEGTLLLAAYTLLGLTFYFLPAAA